MRVLCLLAFLFVNIPPIYAHDHKHHNPPPPEVTPTDSGGSNHSSRKLGYLLLGAGLVYVGYSWGGKKSDNGVKIGVKIKEAP